MNAAAAFGPIGRLGGFLAARSWATLVRDPEGENPVGVSIRNFETLGSEIQGLDLSQPLTPDDRAAIQDALDRHLVVVVRDQHLSDPKLLAFSRNFGDLDPPGPNPSGEQDQPAPPSG